MNMRVIGLLCVLFALPLPGCLESPCSRYGEFCTGGGIGPDGPVACEVMPEVARGALEGTSGAPNADVWALRVTDEFEDVQILDVVAGWDPAGTAWADPDDADEGDADCACNSDGGCPSMQVLNAGPGWVFVEVYGLEEDQSARREYTLHAVGVQSALLLRQDVPRAEDPADYGTTPPGLCERNAIGSDVQLPWVSGDDAQRPLPLGRLEAPGVCVLADISDCGTNWDQYAFQKVGPNPTRLTLSWYGPENLDLVSDPGGTAQTLDNPETIVASIPNNATANVFVNCNGGMSGVIPYALALETYGN